MFCINVDKLIGKMAEKKYTNQKMAKALGISHTTMTKYLRFPNKMNYCTIKNISLILTLERKESEDIFFAKELT